MSLTSTIFVFRIAYYNVGWIFRCCFIYRTPMTPNIFLKHLFFFFLRITNCFTEFFSKTPVEKPSSLLNLVREKIPPKKFPLKRSGFFSKAVYGDIKTGMHTLSKNKRNPHFQPKLQTAQAVRLPRAFILTGDSSCARNLITEFLSPTPWRKRQ